MPRLSSSTPHSARLLGATLAFALAGCASAPPMTGTWSQSDASTTLPMSLGGGELDIDATVVLSSDTGTFDMTLSLAALGLTDVIRAQGTYVDAEPELTLTFTGFVIDAESSSSQEIGPDGAQCIMLAGFADTPVCFPATQTHAFEVDEDTLTITLSHSIAGDPESLTTLRLTRVAEAPADGE